MAPDQADQEQPVYYAPNTLDDFTGLESLAAARNVGGARPIARGYQVAMGPYKQPIQYQGQTYVSAEVQAKLQKQSAQQAWIEQQHDINRRSLESQWGPLSREDYKEVLRGQSKGQEEARVAQVSVAQCRAPWSRLGHVMRSIAMIQRRLQCAQAKEAGQTPPPGCPRNPGSSGPLTTELSRLQSELSRMQAQIPAQCNTPEMSQQFQSEIAASMPQFEATSF